VLFTLLISDVNAEVPKISVKADTIAVVNHITDGSNIIIGFELKPYLLTIDYSKTSSLRNMRIYYRVNDGENKRVNFNSRETSITVDIKDDFNLTNAINTITVFAENSFGRSEEMKIDVFTHYIHSFSDTDEDTGVIINIFQFPLNTVVNVEKITDPDILAKIPLLNATVYKITPMVNGELAGPLVAQYRDAKAMLSTIRVTIPFSEIIAEKIKSGEISRTSVGFVIDENWGVTHIMTNASTIDDSFAFINSHNSLIYTRGYQYLAIATGIDPNHESQDDNYDEIDNSTDENIWFSVISGVILTIIIVVIIILIRNKKITPKQEV